MVHFETQFIICDIIIPKKRKKIVSVGQMSSWSPDYFQIFQFLVYSLSLFKFIATVCMNAPFEEKLFLSSCDLIVVMIVLFACPENITYCCNVGDTIFIYPQCLFADFIVSIKDYLEL
ncbi:hypothetical protein TNIN_153411 [Trichonephila inaurata madagascariensis]|uniref:Uncharacterized protein n=1 Tax=Trichonephila inaurata madagascariensis TaxID=2747483 RepID=A0A8X7CNN4_9ARAC|nr:hypothetical protein TNIN_153411 [Trichonephila inaurata madagascariensis]